VAHGVRHRRAEQDADAFPTQILDAAAEWDSGREGRATYDNCEPPCWMVRPDAPVKVPLRDRAHGRLTAEKLLVTSSAPTEQGTSMTRGPKIQKKAGQLRALAAEDGVFLVAAEAEDILASSVEAIAAQFGISERWALERYVTAHYIQQLAAQLAAASRSYREAADAAEPVTLSAFQAARVIGALGMAVKLAAAHAETSQAESLGIIHDGADSIVGIAAAAAGAPPAQQLQVGGSDLVLGRRTLNHAIQLIDSGQWDCNCETRHQPKHDCGLRRTLSGDLRLLGSWPAPGTP